MSVLTEPQRAHLLSAGLTREAVEAIEASLQAANGLGIAVQEILRQFVADPAVQALANAYWESVRQREIAIRYAAWQRGKRPHWKPARKCRRRSP